MQKQSIKSFLLNKYIVGGHGAMNTLANNNNSFYLCVKNDKIVHQELCQAL